MQNDRVKKVKVQYMFIGLLEILLLWLLLHAIAIRWKEILLNAFEIDARPWPGNGVRQWCPDSLNDINSNQIKSSTHYFTSITERNGVWLLHGIPFLWNTYWVTPVHTVNITVFYGSCKVLLYKSYSIKYEQNKH